MIFLISDQFGCCRLVMVVHRGAWWVLGLIFLFEKFFRLHSTPPAKESEVVRRGVKVVVCSIMSAGYVEGMLLGDILVRLYCLHDFKV